MGLFDSILGAVSGKTEGSGGAAQLIGVLGGLLAQSGGLQGLANKFAQSGQENAFQSCGGPSARIGGFASIAVAESWWPISQRPVHSSVKATSSLSSWLPSQELGLRLLELRT